MGAGEGKTVNLSSSGVLFRTDRPLPIGTPLELSIDWPVLLNDRTPLLLVTGGEVCRIHSSLLAVQIRHYEWRTRAVHYGQPRLVREWLRSGSK